MDLFERMKDVMKSGAEEFSLRVQIVGLNAVGVFGGGGILILSSTEIVVDCGKVNLAIVGENLKIARCEKSEIYISGEINSVEKRKK